MDILQGIVDMHLRSGGMFNNDYCEFTK